MSVGLQVLRDALYVFKGLRMEVVGEKGQGGGEVGWGVGKEVERKEDDFVMLWCSFYIWTRSSWMPFPLLFEAAVWPSVWLYSLVQAWSGMRLFDRWSHDNQPRWASLDKSIFCLHIPCVDAQRAAQARCMILPFTFYGFFLPILCHFKILPAPAPGGNSRDICLMVARSGPSHTKVEVLWCICKFWTEVTYLHDAEF